MHTVVRNVKRISFLPIIRDYFGDDKPQGTPTEIISDRSIAKKETGWDRIKRMFQIDEFGEISHELNTVLQAATLSMFVGAIYGGTIRSRNAYIDFMKNNQATTFQNHFEAKKKLQDKVTIAFAKGALKFGWRLTLFSTTFVGITTLIQTYRGNSGIIEYSAAGGLAGFLYKFNAGPKAWVVASGLGSALGLFCGCVTWGVLNVLGLSMDEARYWQYQWRHTRRTLTKETFKKDWEDKDFAIIKLHDEKIGKIGHNLDNLEKETSDKNDVNNTVE